jgi:hypothetical protein
MTYVSKEVPTGAVNGSNKVFTWLNVPVQFDDLWIDGAIYTAYSLVGNVMTLVDAPTVSIFGDYSYGPSQISIAGTSSLGDIKAEIWALLGQKPTSTTFSDARVTQKANSTIREILKGRVVSLFDPRVVYRCGKMWFMEEKFSFRYQGGSIINDTFEVGDVEISCDTTYLLTAGYVQVGGEVFAYTGKTATELTGVTGGSASHFNGDAVTQLYEMPGDFEKANQVLWTPAGTHAEAKPIPYDETGTSYHCFNTIHINDAERVLLRVYGAGNGDLVNVEYTKRFDDLTADADLCPFPQDYGITVVAPLAAGELGFNKLMSIAPNSLNLAYVKLRSMYGDFSNAVTVTKQSIRANTYSKRR